MKTPQLKNLRDEEGNHSDIAIWTDDLTSSIVE